MDAVAAGGLGISCKADQPQLTLLQGLAKDWGINVGNDVVLDVSGMGQLIGTDESVPVAASYPRSELIP